MKTAIMILGFLALGCGRFDEDGSTGSGSTQATEAKFDQETSLWDIAKGPLETSDYAFDLTSVLVHQDEVKGDMTKVMDYWKTEDGKKKSNFFKKMPDGSKKDCNVRVFIGIIHNYKNTGNDYGALLFENFYVEGSSYDPCGIIKGEYQFGFSSGKPLIKKM